MHPTFAAVTGNLLAVAAWACAAVAAASLLSPAAPLREPHLLAMQAAGPLNVALAALAVTFGVLSHRPTLTALAAVTLASWAALGLSAALSAAPARGGQGPALRVVSSNVLWGNSTPDALAASLDERHADILVTLETTDTLRHALERGLHHGLRVAGAGQTTEETSAVVWTNLPVVSTRTLPLGERDLPVVVVRVGGRDVTVIGVHVKSPAKRDDYELWERELRRLAEYVDHVHGPVLLAGDFNASLTHRPMRAFDGRLIDAAAAARRPFVATWPVGPGGVSLLSLDHVLLRGLTVGSFSTLRAAGSDHRALQVTVHLPGG